MRSHTPPLQKVGLILLYRKYNLRTMEWVNSEAGIVKNDHGFTLGDLLAAPRGVQAAWRRRLRRFHMDHIWQFSYLPYLGFWTKYGNWWPQTDP